MSPEQLEMPRAGSARHRNGAPRRTALPRPDGLARWMLAPGGKGQATGTKSISETVFHPAEVFHTIVN